MRHANELQTKNLRARRIYNLPAKAPKHERHQSADHRETYDVYTGDVHLKVEWDGQAGSMGRMEVELAAGQWQALRHLAPGTNDMLVTNGNHYPSAFKALFERVGEHSGYRFQVKAVPIQWQIDPDALQGSERDMFVAVLGEHYEYAPGAHPTNTAYQSSTPQGSVHHAELDLVAGQDYELWVRLQNPQDPDDWLEQDPIVRNGSGSGGGGN